MTIPEDVRETLLEALRAYWAEGGLSWPERVARREFVLDALHWLEAQPEAPEPTERWEPVEEQSILAHCECGDVFCAPVPAALRLCRRVEVQP